MKHERAVACNRTDDVVSSLAPTIVLIVDADTQTRALYRDAFARAGCHVVEAADGRDALAKVFPTPPSLIITELTLAFVNGYALCDILRCDPLTADVPIVVVTAAHPEERAERMRIDALLLKPTAPDSLVREARRLIATPRALRGRAITLAKAHQRFTTASPPTPPPVLSCPSCDRALHYEKSHVGGVSDHNPEQWDYFVCQTGCGAFQYRQRTRRLRRVE